MFTVDDKSFPVRRAVFGACVDPCRGGGRPEVTWEVKVECESVHHNNEVWHPTLRIEEATFSQNDPRKLAFSDVAIRLEERGQYSMALFLTGPEYARNLCASFGGRRGNIFDVLVRGEMSDPSTYQHVPLRIMAKIEFAGMRVLATCLRDAVDAIAQISVPEEYEIRPDDGAFLFRFPSENSSKSLPVRK